MKSKILTSLWMIAFTVTMTLTSCLKILCYKLNQKNPYTKKMVKMTTLAYKHILWLCRHVLCINLTFRKVKHKKDPHFSTVKVIVAISSQQLWNLDHLSASCLKYNKGSSLSIPFWKFWPAKKPCINATLFAFSNTPDLTQTHYVSLTQPNYINSPVKQSGNIKKHFFSCSYQICH